MSPQTILNPNLAWREILSSGGPTDHQVVLTDGTNILIRSLRQKNSVPAPGKKAAAKQKLAVAPGVIRATKRYQCTALILHTFFSLSTLPCRQTHMRTVTLNPFISASIHSMQVQVV